MKHPQSSSALLREETRDERERMTLTRRHWNNHPELRCTGYQQMFAWMRHACAEPDGEFMAYSVLRICVENRVPFPLWAARELLKHGDRLMRTPTRRGHNPRAIDRDVQRTIDELRYAVVEKFRRTERLSWREAVERAVEYLGTTMGGTLLGHNGRRFPIQGESGAIEGSYAREARRLKGGKALPRLRPL